MGRRSKYPRSSPSDTPTATRSDHSVKSRSSKFAETLGLALVIIQVKSNRRSFDHERPISGTTCRCATGLALVVACRPWRRTLRTSSIAQQRSSGGLSESR